MKSHKEGTLETIKHLTRRQQYHKNLAKILDLGHEKEDLLHHFPAFVGNLTLLRNFTLYELYKRTLGISGHCAEIGVFKGAGSILFGKLIQIFEPDGLTMVHGFDNWGGTRAVPENPLQVQDGNKEDEDRVRQLVALQGLENTVKIHTLDIEKDLPEFFNQHPHLRFKLIFLDSGTYECTSAAIKEFWHRLNIGGILVFDQYCNEVAPGETRAVTELLPNEKIETMHPSWMPASFIVKRTQCW